MTARAFNTAAKSETPYLFDMDREVADFYRDCPDQKQKIFFINATVPSGMLYRGEENDEDEVAALIGQNGHLQDAVKASYDTGICGSVRYDGEGYDCVILKTPRNRKNVNLLGYAAPSDVTDVFSFDHEIGHLICPGGYEGSPRKKECVADAYAVIRHIQRFGVTEALEELPKMRTVEMILGNADDHFTVSVVEKILADAQTTDFLKLSTADTVKEAARYAAESDMNNQFVSYIAQNFKDQRLGVDGIAKQDFSALRRFGEFVLRTEIPEEFKWGAAAVRAVLDGNIGFDGACLPKPQDPEWVKLRKELDDRATRFRGPTPRLTVVSHAL